MISVCIATYNGGKFIKEQLDSILCQLSSTDEIVISDDGSTDDTLEIIKSYHDPRIKVYKFERTKEGLLPINLVTTNFENALHYVNGDFIFFADQDDIWLKDKVKIMLHHLQNVYCVISDCIIVDSNLAVISSSRNFQQKKGYNNKWKTLIGYAPYQGCNMAIRRRVLEKALPFPNGIQSHDRWIGYVSAFFYTWSVINDKLILYRRHSQNTSCKCKNSFLKRGVIRFKYIYELLRLFIKRNYSEVSNDYRW